MQHRRSLTVGLAGASAVVAAMCREPTQTRIIARPSAVDAGPDVRTGPGSPVTVTTRFVGGSERTATWGDGGLDSGTLSGGDTLLRLTHSYATARTYAIKVSGDSPEGDAVSDTLAAVVDATGVPQVLIGAGGIGGCGPDRKGVVEGKSGDLGGRRIIKKKKTANSWTSRARKYHAQCS